MITGTGIDIVEIGRIEAAIQRHGQRFIRRIFTPAEIEYCEKRKDKHRHYAARFAAKEAAFKAMGTGLREGLRWTDVEVKRPDPRGRGKHCLALRGRAEEMVAPGKVRAFVSLSHSDKYALAQVILEKID